MRREAGIRFTVAIPGPVREMGRVCPDNSVRLTLWHFFLHRDWQEHDSTLIDMMSTS